MVKIVISETSASDRSQYSIEDVINNDWLNLIGNQDLEGSNVGSTYRFT